MSVVPLTRRWFEDFALGQRFTSPRRRVPADEIKAFALLYDPQPFHLDEAAAGVSMFEGLAASGWHTAALAMSLALQSGLRPAGGMIGLGVDELRWPEPLRPDDVIHTELEVQALRPMRSRADAGVLGLRMTVRNQHGRAVFDCLGRLLVPRRVPAAMDVAHERNRARTSEAALCTANAD